MGSIFSRLKKEKKVRLKSDPVGILSKIKIFLKSKKDKIFKKLSESKDFETFLKDIIDVVVTGFLINVSLSLFGVKISIIYILSFGVFWYLLSRKILPELKSLISSFNLIRVGR